MKKLVLVTGTGRSGTSTMSGTLHHLGLFVPGPHLGANRSNPKGFFESTWAIRFHRKITTAAGIDFFDGRPGAFDRAQAAITPELRRELVEFIRERSAGHDQVVVKDPRTVWAQALWHEAATEAGLEICYISMLRHPAEVVGSRRTYYVRSENAARLRRYEVTSLARWVNGSIISERETRGHQRAFVKYVDLLTGWRPALEGLGRELGLRYNADISVGGPNPVDDFIDPDLRRHTVSWDDLEVPADLQDVAQAVWDDLVVLSERAGVDHDASADLDVQAARYGRVLDQAAAVSHDKIVAARAEGRREGARTARRRQARSRARAEAASLDERRVGEVGGRDLAKVLWRRAQARMPRHG